MIKTDRKKASTQGIAPPSPAQETPFHFNELNELVNEKIRTSNRSGSEQLCSKRSEYSMDLLLPYGMFP
ncbi:MAG TPA: hypothetical protein VGA15_04290 [Bradyrhizobium sp.]